MLSDLDALRPRLDASESENKSLLARLEDLNQVHSRHFVTLLLTRF